MLRCSQEKQGGPSTIYLPLAERICKDEGVALTQAELLNVIGGCNGSFRSVVLNITTAAWRKRLAEQAKTLAAAAIKSAGKTVM